MGVGDIKFVHRSRRPIAVEPRRRLLPGVSQLCCLSLVILIIGWVRPAASQTGPLPPGQIVSWPGGARSELCQAGPAGHVGAVNLQWS